MSGEESRSPPSGKAKSAVLYPHLLTRPPCLAKCHPVQLRTLQVGEGGSKAQSCHRLAFLGPACKLRLKIKPRVQEGEGRVEA